MRVQAGEPAPHGPTCANFFQSGHAGRDDRPLLSADSPDSFGRNQSSFFFLSATKDRIVSYVGIFLASASLSFFFQLGPLQPEPADGLPNQVAVQPLLNMQV